MLVVEIELLRGIAYCRVVTLDITCQLRAARFRRIESVQRKGLLADQSRSDFVADVLAAARYFTMPISVSSDLAWSYSALR